MCDLYSKLTWDETQEQPSKKTKLPTQEKSPNWWTKSSKMDNTCLKSNEIDKAQVKVQWHLVYHGVMMIPSQDINHELKDSSNVNKITY